MDPFTVYNIFTKIKYFSCRSYIGAIVLKMINSRSFKKLSAMIGHAFHVLCLNFHNFKFCIIILKIRNEIIKKYMITKIVIK